MLKLKTICQAWHRHGCPTPRQFYKLSPKHYMHAVAAYPDRFAIVYVRMKGTELCKFDYEFASVKAHRDMYMQLLVEKYAFGGLMTVKERRIFGRFLKLSPDSGLLRSRWPDYNKVSSDARRAVPKSRHFVDSDIASYLTLVDGLVGLPTKRMGDLITCNYFEGVTATFGWHIWKEVWDAKKSVNPRAALLDLFTKKLEER